MQKRFLKNHVNFQRYKVPSRWIIRSNTTEHSLVLASQKTTKLLKTEHLKSVLFYIKKYIGRKAKRPRFLIKPRY